MNSIVYRVRPPVVLVTVSSELASLRLQGRRGAFWALGRLLLSTTDFLGQPEKPVRCCPSEKTPWKGPWCVCSLPVRVSTGLEIGVHGSWNGTHSPLPTVPWALAWPDGLCKIRSILGSVGWTSRQYQSSGLDLVCVSGRMPGRGHLLSGSLRAWGHAS